MELLFQFILLGAALFSLWKTGELSVHFALGVSKIFRIHQFSIGFFLFAISTGLPEISSAVVSSLKNVPELSVGDLMGSSLVNVSLILGVITLVGKEIEISPFLRKKLFKAIGCMVVVIVWIALQKKDGILTGSILALLYLFSIFWFQGGLPKEETKSEIEEIEEEVEKLEKKGFFSPKVDILIKLFGSLAILLLSSWVLVHSAIRISKIAGIHLGFLGGTVVAVGTSFPELVLEIHAIRKKEYALALGDLFGSTLVNISFILGLLLLFNREVDLTFIFKIIPFIAAIFLWVGWALFFKKPLRRKDGLFFLTVFLSYVGWTFYLQFSH